MRIIIMLQKNKIELLWSELSSISNIEDRKFAIYKDVHSNLRKYQVLAEEEPLCFFKILGGGVDSDIIIRN
jgi:hypothetical protein